MAERGIPALAERRVGRRQPDDRRPYTQEIAVVCSRIAIVLFSLLLTALANSAWADAYQDTVDIFASAGESGAFFDRSYGYAVFPTVGKGGFGVGGGFGKGRVYVGGRHVGNTSVTQLTIGWQLGGQAYSMIIFFQDRRAFEEFTSGNFELSAQATAVAITAGASAAASTAGSSAGASGTSHDATTVGEYYKGMAVFTVAKGGLMYEASVGGQKFSYTPL
jgi:lipid-binding SYLF domain-containing protein